MTTGDGAVQAAGAVLWRPADHGVEVAVIHRPDHDDWTLPKGKLDPGESHEEAARREVAEETGHRGRLGADLGTIAYSSKGAPKVVRYWSMAAESGAFSPSDEVDELRWLPPDEARSLLSYDRDVAVLERFLARAELQSPQPPAEPRP